MPQREALVQVMNLKKFYPIKEGLLRRTTGYIKAVDDISFDIFKGETLGLVGESGCGKTTVARAILQLQRPTAGSVLVEGRDVVLMKGEELRRMRTKMQIIFQNPYSSLNPRMTVGNMIVEPMTVHGILKGQQAKDRTAELLGLVGLSKHFVNRFPSEFSGGQRQRIGIARALALNPTFVICDEPISSLDVSIQSQIVNLLKRLQSQLGLTYLFISHDLRMVRYMSDRTAVMYLGKVVELASSNALFAKPLHPYTKALWSAVPIPDPVIEEGRERIVLEGDVPSPANPPRGCYFCTRCPVVMDVCRQIEPVLREVESRHSVACHLYN